MGNVFSVAEVIDLGIEKEKTRRDFYEAVAGKFQDKAMNELFIKLRDWETQHIEKFEAIKVSVDDGESTEAYPGEQHAYMQALIDEQLYKESSLEAFVKTVATPLAAVQHGMGFEREAILFFSALQKFLRPAHQQTIQKLINEEKQHLIYLSELKKKLTT